MPASIINYHITPSLTLTFSPHSLLCCCVPTHQESLLIEKGRFRQIQIDCSAFLRVTCVCKHALVTSRLGRFLSRRCSSCHLHAEESSKYKKKEQTKGGKRNQKALHAAGASICPATYANDLTPVGRPATAATQAIEMSCGELLDTAVGFPCVFVVFCFP